MYKVHDTKNLGGRIMNIYECGCGRAFKDAEETVEVLAQMNLYILKYTIVPIQCTACKQAAESNKDSAALLFNVLNPRSNSFPQFTACLIV